MTRPHDHVASILEAWRAEQPGLDLSPVAIFGRITRIDRYKAAALREVYARHRLDAGEYDILAALRRSGPGYQLTPTDLCQSMLVSSATMTERLDRLERRDLIRRRPATRDRRSVLVELTVQGRTVIDQAHAELLDTEAALLGGLSVNDRSALSRLLTKLSALLEQTREAPPSST